MNSPPSGTDNTESNMLLNDCFINARYLVQWGSRRPDSTDSTQKFRNLLHVPLSGQGLATSRLPPLWVWHGKQHSLRHIMVQHTQHMSQLTQLPLLLLDTFLGGRPRFTTEQSFLN
ncbi:hypothetical protein CSKR_103298 [Clonorchis sinensis]|uniref:Uncharacterized protein n=1 Tax=Clonorchis sinensis TaxID=79923 RepID=A0A3R7EVS7_CLOSI|nr:hypothetical protein CSKR_103298 [Clonorchis sinensis]